MYLLWVHASTTVPWLVQVGSNVLWCISLPLFDIIWDVSRCTIPGAISTIICVWSWMFFFLKRENAPKGIFWMVGNSGISSESLPPWEEQLLLVVKTHDVKPCGSSGSARRSMVWAWPREMPIPMPRWPAPCGFATAMERGQRGGNQVVRVRGSLTRWLGEAKYVLECWFLLAIFRVGVPVKSCHLTRPG